MHFGVTVAQETLAARLRLFLDEVSSPSEVRRLMETSTGFDPDVWERMAVEEGLPGLHLPVALGGAGLGWIELAVALGVAGGALLCAPYLATATAAAVILASTDTTLAEEILPRIATGRCIATLAVAEDTGRWDESGVDTRAVASAGGGGWRLEGRKSFVVDGCTADLFVVAARHDDGVSLFLVDGGAPGLTLQALPTVDQTRKQAGVRLSATPARLLPGVSQATALDLCAVALAAEQVGGAQRCLDAAVDHARRRVQFGRPIGSFQAVKHLCADMHLDLESARSVALSAARAVGREGELPEAAAVAKIACSESYVRVATESLHVHGGLGFTWDHDAHLYFKRARSSAHLFGDPSYQRERLCRLLDL